MDDMTKWAVVVSAEHYESERLYGTDILTLPPPPAAPGPGDFETGAPADLATGASGDLATGASGDLVAGASGDLVAGASGDLVAGGSVRLAAGDEALLIAATAEPVVFGLARADADGTLHYTVNLLDAPIPAGTLATTTPET